MRLRALLLSFLLIASCNAFADPAPPSAAKVTPVPAAEPTETALPAAAPPKVAPAPVDVHVTVEKPKDEPREVIALWGGLGMKLSDILMVGFTFLLMAATIVLAVYTYKLFKEAMSSGRTATRASKAALASAIAAQDSALVAVAAEQPRWILGKNIVLLYHRVEPKPERRIDVEITMYNYGRTNAEIIETAVRATMLKEDDKTEITDWRWNPEPKAEHGVMVAPKIGATGGHPITFSTLLNNADTMAIRSGTARFFLYGEILYRDFRDQLMRKGFGLLLDPDKADFFSQGKMPGVMIEARDPHLLKYTFTRPVGAARPTVNLFE